MGYSWPGFFLLGASGRTGRFFHPAVVPQPHFNLFSLRSCFLELYVTWIVYYVSMICRVPFSLY